MGQSVLATSRRQPNVFTDLISHSRPISNDGGTVVYEVPINRVHCSSGILGIPDCQDTGKSVTMRIVANINEGSPAVPGGGQKGGISMYFAGRRKWSGRG